MKTLLSFLIILVGASSIANAQQQQKRYCDDMARVQNLPHLDKGQFDRYLAEKGSVSRILVSKYKHELYLLNEKEEVLKTYKVAFGMDPWGGTKRFQGDQKTPEGIYEIDYKNPQSAYLLSLHVSYPNAADIAYAKSRGKDPGGDIMVHGFPVNPIKHAGVSEVHPSDWTQGCIAVTDSEIREIFTLVKEKTTIEICSYQQR